MPSLSNHPRRLLTTLHSGNIRRCVPSIFSPESDATSYADDPFRARCSAGRRNAHTLSVLHRLSKSVSLSWRASPCSKMLRRVEPNIHAPVAMGDWSFLRQLLGPDLLGPLLPARGGLSCRYSLRTASGLRPARAPMLYPSCTLSFTSAKLVTLRALQLQGTMSGMSDALASLGGDITFAVSWSLASEMLSGAREWQLSDDELVGIVLCVTVVLSALPAAVGEAYARLSNKEGSPGESKGKHPVGLSHFILMLVSVAHRVAISVTVQLLSASARATEPLRGVRILTLASVIVFFVFLESNATKSASNK